MSPRKQKRVQQIQRDDQGRLILSSGPFAKKFVLTEQQASELQPLIDGFYIWDKRLRRWLMPFFCMMLVIAVGVVSDVSMKTVLLFIVGIGTIVMVGIQINIMKQPWYRTYCDLLKDLHKTAPRA